MDKHENYEYLENFISYRAERAMDKFEKNLALLNIIITLAPVLGLLGTVTGMMGSFSKLVERGQDPMAVTAGLAEALIYDGLWPCHFHHCCLHSRLFRTAHEEHYAEHRRNEQHPFGGCTQEM